MLLQQSEDAQAVGRGVFELIRSAVHSSDGWNCCGSSDPSTTWPRQDTEWQRGTIHLGTCHGVVCKKLFQSERNLELGACPIMALKGGFESS
jgi:hypothetical protein